jgi:hypothetical protein
MTKNIIAQFFFVGVLSLMINSAEAFEQKPVPAPMPDPCPTIAAVKKLAARPAVATAPVARTISLPAGRPDWTLTAMFGAILLLVVAVAFLLGRLTAPVAAQPQVVAPVVYIQPPDPQRMVRP